MTDALDGPHEPLAGPRESLEGPREPLAGPRESLAGPRDPFAELRARLAVLEAHVAIRAVMADYMRICDHLDESTPMQQLADLFTEDAEWLGVGNRYAAAFGSHRGRAAIVAMLERYRAPPHFAFNAHFLTSEKITVSGATAQGEWLMLQTSTYSTGASDLRSARLSVDFACTGSRWRIHRFATENLFTRPVDHWNDPTPMPVPAHRPQDDAE